MDEACCERERAYNKLLCDLSVAYGNDYVNFIVAGDSEDEPSVVSTLDAGAVDDLENNSD